VLRRCSVRPRILKCYAGVVFDLVPFLGLKLNIGVALGPFKFKSD